LSASGGERGCSPLSAPPDPEERRLIKKEACKSGYHESLREPNLFEMQSGEMDIQLVQSAAPEIPLSQWCADQTGLIESNLGDGQTMASLLSAQAEVGGNLSLNAQTQKLILSTASELKGRSVDASLDPCGCKLVQLCIQFGSSRISVLDELKGHYEALRQSKWGIFVLDKAVAFASLDYVCDFMLREYNETCIEIAQDDHGCRIQKRFVQRLYESGDKRLYPLVDQIVQATEQLAPNKFGNVVIREVVAPKTNGGCKDHFQEKVTETCFLRFENYARHEYAGYVTEELLERCSQDLCDKFAGKLLNSRADWARSMMQAKRLRREPYILYFLVLRTSKMISHKMVEQLVPVLKDLKETPYLVLLKQACGLMTTMAAAPTASEGRHAAPGKPRKAKVMQRAKDAHLMTPSASPPAPGPGPAEGRMILTPFYFVFALEGPGAQLNPAAALIATGLRQLHQPIHWRGHTCTIPSYYVFQRVRQGQIDRRLLWLSQ
jgi:hypothetical protein